MQPPRDAEREAVHNIYALYKDQLYVITMPQPSSHIVGGSHGNLYVWIIKKKKGEGSREKEG